MNIFLEVQNDNFALKENCIVVVACFFKFLILYIAINIKNA